MPKNNNKNNQNQQVDNDLNQVIYQQLRNLAYSLMVKERNNHTLSPTDLVHEAYLKISEDKSKAIYLPGVVGQQLIVKRIGILKEMVK